MVLHHQAFSTYFKTTLIRFTVLHRPGSSDWTLAIKYVSVKDEGVYVCQVKDSDILYYSLSC